MPNWCENILILRCNDPAQIQRAAKAYYETRLLSEFIPEPNTVDPSETMDDWRSQNWGTSWDVGRDCDCADLDIIVVSETATLVSFHFETAWRPPVKAMEAFEAAGFSVDLYYYEGNMCFCGLYSTDGGDHRYDIPSTVAEVREKIPDAINDAFAISDAIAEMQEIEPEELETEETCMKFAVTQLPQESEGISPVHRPRKIIIKLNKPYEDKQNIQTFIDALRLLVGPSDEEPSSDICRSATDSM